MPNVNFVDTATYILNTTNSIATAATIYSKPIQIIMTAIPITSPNAPNLSSSSDSGFSDSDLITNNTTPTFTGTVDSLFGILLFEGTNQVGASTADSDGIYTITSSTLAEGSYSCVKTCNSWVNLALKESDLKSCLWTPYHFRIIEI